MSAAEEVMDVVEDVIESVDTEWVSGFTQKEVLVSAGIVGAVTAVLAGAATYWVVTRKLEAKYEAIAKQEIAEARAFYQSKAKAKTLIKEETRKEKKTFDEQINAAKEALDLYQGGEEDESEPEDEESVVVESSVNVFLQGETGVQEGQVPVEELNSRTPDAPYVISAEEFFQNEEEFSQKSVTWYQGDQTLADDGDQEISFPDPVVGEENLNRFGHYSNDPRIVYVRNERLSSDFEVLLSDGKFSHEVLGLQHSDGGHRGRRQDTELRRFRGGIE